MAEILPVRKLFVRIIYFVLRAFLGNVLWQNKFSLTLVAIFKSTYMEPTTTAYQISPLGDTALLIDFGNKIDENVNKEVIARAKQLKENLATVIEVVPAYSSVTVYFNPIDLKKLIAKNKLAYEFVKEEVERVLLTPLLPELEKERLIKIPVCYEQEFAPDIYSLASRNNLSVEEIIALHVSKIYRVFMLGFLPGGSSIEDFRLSVQNSSSS